jgi:eukaryotic-like serine/threonine-protein kinase
VWRARDAKLHRDVAVKVLPDAFAGDAERLARFQREAQVLASLNHPNIAQIYGFEESSRTTCIVMELVEGETLEHRLGLPQDEALPIARQIAEALEAAHERGIVHRDLKPANIIVTAQGVVKVLDFGLAKELTDTRVSSTLSNSPTWIDGSLPGTMLGTAAYMSPEQARGKAVDRRTDIWAFGCVLFELLTGRKAFSSQTAIDTVSAILSQEPDWRALPASTPAHVRRLLRRCLMKEPRDRLQHIGDARIELSATEVEAASPAPTGKSPSGSGLLPWALAAIGLGVAAFALLARQSPPLASTPKAASKFSIDLPIEAPLAPPGSFLLSEGRSSLAMTRDGRHLAYVAFVGNRRQLYLRDMVTGHVGPVSGSDDAQDPFFSPDGGWIGFFAEHKLKKIPVAGGTPDILADAVTGHGGVWGPDQIYFTPGYSQPISRIAPGGGAVQPVTTLGSDSLHSLPSLVPDGSALLFTADKTILLTVDVLRLGTEQPARTIIDVGADARYVPTGHLVFGADGRLLVAPFDRQTLQVTGTPTAVLDGVRTEARGSLQAVWSDDGTLVYVPGPDMATARLVWLDRMGRQEPLAAAPANFSQFALSPDGKQLALSIRDRATRDIWVHEIGRGAQQRLTFSGSAAYPVWSRDGTSIFFMMQTAAGSGVYEVRLGDSDRTPREIITSKSRINPIEDTPTGLIVATSGDLMLLPLTSTIKASAGERALIPVLNGSGYAESLSRLSPDTKWLAYTSDETGQAEVYLTSYPDRQVKKQVSTAGGEEPRWRPGGREIIYRYGAQWFSAPFTDKPSLALGTPRLLFEGPYINVPGYSWAMTPDGDRYLLLENPDLQRRVTTLTVLTNFFDEIRRRTGSPQ